MKEFILANWYYLAVFALALAGFVISIAMKRKGGKTNLLDSVKSALLEQIPLWADLVEKPGNGEQKKEAVIELALNEAKAYLGRELTQPEQQAIITLASSHLEDVLKAPKAKSKKSKYTVK